ncbi:unnamed protein product [Linum tenue]|uniref:MYB transcription factor n=1 Tax=Linum tenue TaxID=586396 RepID=A0AAV0J7E3_9ROSI|nr:unnamed protein product [Linum tenue]CAI0406378.1 unnamed protein product [Linum tenue]
MGAPKQKWTAEEEAALKAGVVKHGTGKWRTILMDPEFSAVLQLRSNVDLKDKWRNINVTAIWGSRQKAKLALKSSPQTLKNDQSSSPPTSRLDSLILEAIATLKEPGGSDGASIAMYIEVYDKQWAVPKLRKLLAGNLKRLTAAGKLIKVKHKYRIVPSSPLSKGKKRTPLSRIDEDQKDTSNLEKNGTTKMVTESQVEQGLLRIQGMTAQEAADAAAKAVAEAEAAIAEAEKATREADRAEAEAEARQVFAKAALKAFKLCARHS